MPPAFVRRIVYPFSELATHAPDAFCPVLCSEDGLRQTPFRDRRDLRPTCGPNNKPFGLIGWTMLRCVRYCDHIFRAYVSAVRVAHAVGPITSIRRTYRGRCVL